MEERKLREQINIKEFLKAVDQCDGEVFFKTAEEDQLNLKSMLTKYIFATLLNSPEIIQKAVVECQAAEDYKRLAAFLA